MNSEFISTPGLRNATPALSICITINSRAGRRRATSSARSTPVVQSLAQRNLSRGARLVLPSHKTLRPPWASRRWATRCSVTDPLWCGILKESEVLHNGARHGPARRHHADANPFIHQELALQEARKAGISGKELAPYIARVITAEYAQLTGLLGPRDSYKLKQLFAASASES